MENDLLQALKEAIVEGEDNLAAEKAAEAVASGIEPQRIVTEGVLAGIQRAGELWQANQFFLPDVILSAEAFKAAMQPVEPLLKASNANGPRPKFLLGVVKGDMHDLGKNLVVAMLEARGFEVIDLGVDVPSEVIVAKARETKPAIVGLGAYMTTTMSQMKNIIAALGEAGLRDGIKVMVGGVPTSQAFAEEIGADAWGQDALDAADKASKLVLSGATEVQ